MRLKIAVFACLLGIIYTGCNYTFQNTSFKYWINGTNQLELDSFNHKIKQQKSSYYSSGEVETPGIKLRRQKFIKEKEWFFNINLNLPDINGTTHDKIKATSKVKIDSFYQIPATTRFNEFVVSTSSITRIIKSTTLSDAIEYSIHGSFKDTMKVEMKQKGLSEFAAYHLIEECIFPMIQNKIKTIVEEFTEKE